MHPKLSTNHTAYKLLIYVLLLRYLTISMYNLNFNASTPFSQLVHTVVWHIFSLEMDLFQLNAREMLRDVLNNSIQNHQLSDHKLLRFVCMTVQMFDVLFVLKRQQ